MEEVFAPCHRMHGGATGQPIPTFASGCKVWCIRRAVHSDTRRRAGLIDQPSAENDFLSEKPQCWNDPPPITECPIPTLSAGNVPGKCVDDGPWLSYDRTWSVSSWLEQRTRSPHSWVDNNPWSCCNVQRTCQMWMQKSCSGVCSCRKHAHGWPTWPSRSPITITSLLLFMYGSVQVSMP